MTICSHVKFGRLINNLNHSEIYNINVMQRFLRRLSDNPPDRLAGPGHQLRELSNVPI